MAALAFVNQLYRNSHCRSGAVAAKELYWVGRDCDAQEVEAGERMQHPDQIDRSRRYDWHGQKTVVVKVFSRHSDSRKLAQAMALEILHAIAGKGSEKVHD